MNDLTKRFLKYIKIDTTSDESSETCPSSPKIWDLAKVLVEDLKELGLEDITIDENSYIMATLPANTENIDTIGFIAHMDTAPSYSGTDIKPRIIEDYDGKDIILNEKKNIVLSIRNFPELVNYKGQSLIVTDGMTLLGADDKAGVTEIMEAVKYLKEHDEIKHGDIRIGFTPDEEIGRGAQLFDVEKFGAKFAYTIDGGAIGELEYENFNAASAMIKIKGRDIHPGSAKNKMINALLIAMDLNAMLPCNERPEYTEGYEGFYLLCEMKGDIENVDLEYIIRDHSMEKFEEKKALMKSAVTFLQEKYKEAEIILDLKDSYYNMKKKIEPVMEIVELAKKSMEDVGVEPVVRPIRGGTDGATLSYKGLPCPNIFTGGHNFHGKFEYVSIQSMEKARDVIIKICENNAK